MLICLSPPATHIIQQLDEAVIKSLKSHWKYGLGRFKMKEKREIEKYELATLLKNVMDMNKEQLVVVQNWVFEIYKVKLFYLLVSFSTNYYLVSLGIK